VEDFRLGDTSRMREEDQPVEGGGWCVEDCDE
jgi:hypothetical protein